MVERSCHAEQCGCKCHAGADHIGCWALSCKAVPIWRVDAYYLVGWACEDHLEMVEQWLEKHLKYLVGR